MGIVCMRCSVGRWWIYILSGSRSFVNNLFHISTKPCFEYFMSNTTSMSNYYDAADCVSSHIAHISSNEVNFEKCVNCCSLFQWIRLLYLTAVCVVQKRFRYIERWNGKVCIWFFIQYHLEPCLLSPLDMYLPEPPFSWFFCQFHSLIIYLTSAEAKFRMISIGI